MGARQSTSTPRVRTYTSGVSQSQSTGGASSVSGTSGNLSGLSGNTHRSGGASGSNNESRIRARSLGSVPFAHLNQPITISTNGAYGGSGSPDSDASTPEEGPGPFTRVLPSHSLPVHFVSLNGIKCPVCSKFVLPEDIECHLVMCLTKPRISYNEDVLSEDKGECVICLDDLKQGDTIARLPCLCIYHKSCIDSWFEVNRSCPEHPSD